MEVGLMYLLVLTLYVPNITFANMTFIQVVVCLDVRVQVMEISSGYLRALETFPGGATPMIFGYVC